eukprot:1255047-Pleurochrysis_carterae.AAC.1
MGNELESSIRNLALGQGSKMDLHATARTTYQAYVFCAHANVLRDVTLAAFQPIRRLRCFPDAQDRLASRNEKSNSA